jgi:hemolysin activation/secretion protein
MIRYYNYGKWFGNDVNSNKLVIMGNYYYPFNKKMVLASRAVADIGLGDVPFVLQSYVGNTDLRGYTKGEYRGDQVYSAQTEFRWNFYGKWGAVGFTGLALAVTGSDASPILPDFGLGLRYKVIPKYNINLGVDAAVGRDDWGLYFRITEAF